MPFIERQAVLATLVGLLHSPLGEETHTQAASLLTAIAGAAALRTVLLPQLLTPAVVTELTATAVDTSSLSASRRSMEVLAEMVRVVAGDGELTMLLRLAVDVGLCGCCGVCKVADDMRAVLAQGGRCLRKARRCWRRSLLSCRSSGLRWIKARTRVGWGRTVRRPLSLLL